MNAETGQANATGMRAALTPKALTPVAAVTVSVVMECHVMMSMSVQRGSTTVMVKLSVSIHGGHTTAVV